jgi:protein-S-isoprenylcysteine O-methyltransferase Ste14
MNFLALWPWLCWGWLAGEAVIAVLMRTRKSGGKIQDRGSQLMVWLSITAAFVGANWIDRIAHVSMFGQAHWLKTLALIVIVAGITIRITAIVSLGRAFSVNVAIRKAQKVWRGGLYHFVRHPSYLGMELALLAVGIHSRNWAVLVWMLLLPTLALLFRIHVEEAALHQAFGEEYAGYCRVTKRLIPGVF